MTRPADVQHMFADLATRYGTPQYVYELDRVRAAARDLTESLPAGVALHYSLKANPHPAIVSSLVVAGLHTEISSSGELDAVLRAGAPVDGCLYTGPGKTATELDLAIRAGIRLFSVESTADRDRLAGAAARCAVDVRYLIRINAGGPTGGDGLRMTGVPTQFGVDLAMLESPDALFRPVGRVDPVGLHFFSSSNASDQDTLLTQFAGNLRVAAALADSTGLRLRVLDLGGGFPAPFAVPGAPWVHDRLRGSLTSLLDAALPAWREGTPRIAFESGRALVARCGTLLTTVLDVKVAHGRTYVVLDAGVNVLGGMSGLGRLLAPGARPILLGNPADDPAAGIDVSLVGPLCTPLDVHNRRCSLPPLRAGQVLAVPNVGAYGLTASLLGFLSRPIAAEVVLEGSAVTSVRRLELIERELTR